jgi:hypothetical protein
MLSWLVFAGNGDETAEYKALAALYDQMRLVIEKTIANCRKSAHRAPMSEQHDVFVRRCFGLWA